MKAGRWQQSRILLVAVVLALVVAAPAVLAVLKVTNVWVLVGQGRSPRCWSFH